MLLYTFLVKLHGKPYFLFSGRPEQMVFPKIAPEYDLSCIIGKDEISFSQNMILHVRRKMKDDFSLKIHRNVIFSGLLKRWSFQKGPRRHMTFLVLSGKMVFFPKNMIFFPWAEIERRPFSGNTWKHDASSSKEEQET